MKRKRDIRWSVLLLAGTTQLSAQTEEWQRHTFFVHAGYANRLQGTGELTNSSHSYECERSQEKP